MRSPVRASILPDRGRATASGDPVPEVKLLGSTHPFGRMFSERTGQGLAGRCRFRRAAMGCGCSQRQRYRFFGRRSFPGRSAQSDDVGSKHGLGLQKVAPQHANVTLHNNSILL
jgi:hypothetical protein